MLLSHVCEAGLPWQIVASYMYIPCQATTGNRGSCPTQHRPRPFSCRWPWDSERRVWRPVASPRDEIAVESRAPSPLPARVRSARRCYRRSSCSRRTRCWRDSHSARTRSCWVSWAISTASASGTALLWLYRTRHPAKHSSSAGAVPWSPSRIVQAVAAAAGVALAAGSCASGPPCASFYASPCAFDGGTRAGRKWHCTWTNRSKFSGKLLKIETWIRGILGIIDRDFSHNYLGDPLQGDLAGDTPPNIFLLASFLAFFRARLAAFALASFTPCFWGSTCSCPSSSPSSWYS